MTLRYLSVCSGIEAASVAWQPLGWQPVAFAEIDPFASAVLAHRFPTVRNLGDFRDIECGDVGTIDVLVGGTPCQSFSVAGLRRGLDDDRGNLALEFLRLADRTRPRWLVWENVPGVLSSNGGRDFGAILGGMVELGYGFAYRVLDAQHFGVPQRRRRVFVVGYLGDWRPAAAVLFERHSLQGHPPPRREKRERIAPTLSARTRGGGGIGTDFDCDGGLIANSWPADVAPTLNAHFGDKQGLEDQHALAGAGLFVPHTAHSLRAEYGTGRGTPIVPIQSVQSVRDKKQNGIGIGEPGDETFTLTGRDQHAVAYRTSGNCGAWETGDRVNALTTGTDSSSHVLAFSSKDHGADAGDIAPTLRAMGHRGSHANAGGQLAVVLRGREGGATAELCGEVMPALRTGAGGGDKAHALTGMQVRRLTPRECERLQGLPDDWTLVPYRGRPAPDGPRYRAIGNSFPVPVVRWIGERISLVERVTG